jgi:hypothetical protein
MAVIKQEVSRFSGNLLSTRERLTKFELTSDDTNLELLLYEVDGSSESYVLDTDGLKDLADALLQLILLKYNKVPFITPANTVEFVDRPVQAKRGRIPKSQLSNEDNVQYPVTSSVGGEV